MENSNQLQRESISEALKKYKKSAEIKSEEMEIKNPVISSSIPKPSTFNQAEFEKMASRETDPDLIITYELIQLPSKGIFYKNGISELAVEYMTSKDEDLLTTPSLIESGDVLNLLLKRKIKTPGVNVDELLQGDRNAVILFLRTSSYGSDYTVQVTDPRNNTTFQTKVDLLKLKHKEMTIFPDSNGHFNVDIPMRKKNVKFRLLNSGEDSVIYKKSEAIKEAYGEDFSQYSTMKLKASIIDIDGKTDRSYIDKFVDAMPALDAFTIRKKILEVSPDVDMKYEFTAKDGYKFTAELSIGLDFFFPST